MSPTTKTLDDTELEIAADDPLHEETSLPFRRYGIVDHVSHFSGIAISALYLVAALATLWEVVARYVFNAPTQWAFEVVMVLCAASWMISSGYVTLKQRHIGITVFHVMASPRGRWWLDLIAMLVGILALFLLMTDAAIRAYTAIDHVERTGSAFNSPMPMLLKTLLMVGGFLYLAQLTVNLHRHFDSAAWRGAVKTLGALMAFYFVVALAAHYGGADSLAGGLQGFFAGLGEALDPRQVVNMRDYDLSTVSIIMVILLVALMITGMPLGIVTLIVSVLMAVAFFGPRGLYLVSTNAAGLLDHYTLVAIPFFVLMASILERAGIAEDLFDAMSTKKGLATRV